jgi:hypothetical protein
MDAIADPRLRQLAQQARDTGRRPDGALRGLPPDLAGVAVTFHYLNRMVTVFLEDSPLPPQVPAPVKAKLMRMTATVMLAAAGGRLPDGSALALLPESPLPGVPLRETSPPEASLPEEFSWASADPRIAATLARAAATIDAAAAPVVSPPVRELLARELAAWDGRPPGPSRNWTAASLATLPPGDRPTGRLALLTAFAPYQVLTSDISEFKQAQPADEALIQLTSWAAMAAARQIASWLATPARDMLPRNR